MTEGGLKPLYDHRLRIAAAGRVHYERERAGYHELYPDVETPEPILARRKDQMSQQTSEPLDVAIESTADTEDEQVVAAIFEEFGIEVSMHVLIRKADVQLPWELMITAGALGAGFLQTIGKNAGDDVYKQGETVGLTPVAVAQPTHAARRKHRASG